MESSGRVLRGSLMHIYFFELFLIVWLLPFCHNLYANNFGSTPKVVEKVRKDKKRRGSACQRQGKFLKQNL